MVQPVSCVFTSSFPLQALSARQVFALLTFCNSDSFRLFHMLPRTFTCSYALRWTGLASVYLPLNLPLQNHHHQRYCPRPHTSSSVSDSKALRQQRTVLPLLSAPLRIFNQVSRLENIQASCHQHVGRTRRRTCSPSTFWLFR